MLQDTARWYAEDRCGRAPFVPDHVTMLCLCGGRKSLTESTHYGRYELPSKRIEVDHVYFLTAFQWCL